ncbi:hypothetical protein [Chitinimonas lacunae]|uniref:Uncharacterized protein n=1 Tax=Chitinimonas lacunae TaxID=1963018 RepID=A0ABV8MQ84_9NEIS
MRQPFRDDGARKNAAAERGGFLPRRLRLLLCQVVHLGLLQSSKILPSYVLLRQLSICSTTADDGSSRKPANLGGQGALQNLGKPQLTARSSYQIASRQNVAVVIVMSWLSALTVSALKTNFLKNGC